MEPPTKRRRLALEQNPRVLAQDIVYPDTVSQQGSRDEKTHRDPIIVPNLLPTRTYELQKFERNSKEERRAVLGEKLAPAVVPRAPGITVTANVVNIAILDNSGKTSYTQIPAPTTEVHLSIPGVGTITVAGVPELPTTSVSLPVNGESGITSTSLPETSPTGSAQTSSINSTLTDDKTVTVTATSLLQLTAKNGTVTSSSSSTHRKSTFIGDGFTTTLDDSISSVTTTGYRFGDIDTAYLTSTTKANTIAATSTTSSISTQSTSAGSTPGPTIVLTPQQQQMVGGVVGGVAGVALVLLGILYFLRWYKQRLRSQGRLPDQIGRHRQLPSGDDHEYIASSQMIQTTSPALAPVAILKQSLQKLRPHSEHSNTSSQVDVSTYPRPGSERSFQRISGRKIPSVLLNGGDGYGDQGPVSPSSIYSLPRSREISQTSFSREIDPSTNPFIHPYESDAITEHGSPSRSPMSPFVDVPLEDHALGSPLRFGASKTTRNFSVPNAPKSRLTIRTESVIAHNQDRFGDANIAIRPSPARTPTTSSPTSSSLRLPISTPPLLHEDIPEMPPIQPWRHVVGSPKFSDNALSPQRSVGQRSMSAVSMRSFSSTGGKFKEDL